jgi:ribosome recycling factor
MADYQSDLAEKMDKTIHVLREELSGIRAGRANPHLLDKLTVMYYGAPTPVQQVANIMVPEARQIVIQPWEPKTLNDIVKAIQMSDLGLNPNNDGKVIRLIFPPLTEERRRDLTKDVKKLAERDKVALRQLRRESIEHLKKQEKAKEITEDDLTDAEKDVQAITDSYIALVDKIMEGKIEEIMEV